MENTTTVRKTFKDVHAELDLESNFLLEKRDTKDFSEKAAFLEGVGFQKSIATKLYRSLTINNYSLRDMERRYGGIYRFIVEPQL